MERIKNAYRNMPIKKALTVTIIFSLLESVLLGFFVLAATRPGYYRLTASSPQSTLGRVHDGVTLILVGICIIVPILAGIWSFYRHKLAEPLQALLDGTKQIACDNLDFAMQYDAEDELGELCRSFDKMREQLQLNYKQMWHMAQKRKELNAAFAHDLRTPLTVLQGYIDFLEEYIPSPEKSDEKLLSTNRMMAQYIRRLEDYTETMNTIQKLEDTPVKTASVPMDDFMKLLEDSVGLLAKENGKQVSLDDKTGLSHITGDVPLILRAAENVIKNAFCYAKNRVDVSLFFENSMLYIAVTDDGSGFNRKDLECALQPFYTSAEAETGHFGMGLSICKTLCENHGGTVSLENHAGAGAKVQLSFKLTDQSTHGK